MTTDNRQPGDAGILPASGPGPVPADVVPPTVPPTPPVPPGDDVTAASEPVDDEPKKSGSFFRELPFLVVVAFVLALLIKAFLVQAFYIPSGSMEQTLAVGDRVLVNKLVYRFRDIHRGEIVVFNGVDSFTPEVQIQPPSNNLERVARAITGAIGLGQPGEKDFIKRVIAVPGDTVACCTNGNVTVQPPGGEAVELDEPYVFEPDRKDFRPVTVPEGRLFVMGDHRSNSSDSRAHIEDDENMGTVPADKVIGRAFVVVWPLGHTKTLGVPETFDRSALAVPGAAGAATPYALGLVGAIPVVLLRRRLRAWRARAA